MNLMRFANYSLLAVALFVLTPGSASAATRSASPPMAAPRVQTGEIEGAPFRIDIPANWNGDLVMLLHGYEPRGTPRHAVWPQDELAPMFLSKGYAVAASGYSSQGWSVREAIAENDKLRLHFLRAHGAPRRSYMVGVSLGGHIAIASLEKYTSAYDGALSLCGLNISASQAFEEGVLLSLVAFDALFPGVMGLGAAGLSDPASPGMLDPQALEAALRKKEETALLLSRRLEIQRPALAGALMLNYLVLREMMDRAGGFPLDNSATVYQGFGNDAAFNATVRRYRGDRKAMAYLARHANLSGLISRPLVIQSNNADPTIPPRFSSTYSNQLSLNARSHLLVQLPPVGTGHCDFTPEQIGTAFDVLTGWVKSGKQPQLN